MKQDTKVDFDQTVWTIEVPGIPREDIEVFTVKDTLYAQFKDGTRLHKNLMDEEKILSVTLELGILTIVIDRPHKKVPIEVK